MELGLKNQILRCGLVLLAAATVGCGAPGEGPKALVGFRTCVGLVQALGEYRAELGGYPENLEALAPKFLSPAELALPPQLFKLMYKRNAGGFELQFEYHGPGVNRCNFESTKRQWSCHGYY